MQAQKLFDDNQALADRVSRRYCWDNYYLEDLQQESKLALWEAVLLYSEEGDVHEHLFETVAYYKILSSCRDYRNVFFNVVSVPKNESVSKKAYLDLLKMLEFSPGVFSCGVEPEEIISTWLHPIEKELSDELRKNIRLLKSRVSPSKLNYSKVVKRTINFGTPVVLEFNCSEQPETTQFTLDFGKLKESLKLFDRAVLELKVSGNTTAEIATILNQNPRKVKDSFLKTKKALIELQKDD